MKVNVRQIKWRHPSSERVGDSYVATYEYAMWRAKNERCSVEYWGKKPSYKGCTQTDLFSDYDSFYEWCHSNPWFNKYDDKGNVFQLDKDVVTNGGKVYGEDTCVFVPSEINNLFLRPTLPRHLPVGVVKKGSKYIAQINYDGYAVKIGTYETPEEAEQKYLAAKGEVVYAKACRWQGMVDPRVIESLMQTASKLLSK